MIVREAEQQRGEPSVLAIVLVGLLVGATLAWAYVSDVEWPWSRTSSSLSTGDATASNVNWERSGWSIDQPWQRSVVRITNRQCGDEIRGSGVIVDGVVLTNRHVIDGAASVIVTTSDGVAHRATGLSGSGHVDLAAIEVPGVGRGLHLSTLAGSPTAALQIAGFPGGFGFATHAVAVDGALEGSGYPDPDHAAHLDAMVVPGESGSPIIDDQGDVVALLYARSTADGRGLAIDGSQVRSERADLSGQSFNYC